MDTHPLRAFGFEPSTSSLTELGFEPMPAQAQAVGATEPISGRKVVQPTDSPAVNQALATDAMPSYRAQLLAAIRNIPGARLTATRETKNPHRLAEKIEAQGQPAQTVSDYGAAQIAVDSPAAKDAVLAAMKKYFRVLRQQDDFAEGDAEFHYRSLRLQLQMPNGASEELQIVPGPVLDANPREHHEYKKARNAAIAGGNAEPAKAAARAINDAAMEKFDSNHGAARVVKGMVAKGSQVRLADGTLARVAYVDPHMRIARVRTADGRNLTVRHRDLG
jgi:hypothetical protein